MKLFLVTAAVLMLTPESFAGSAAMSLIPNDAVSVGVIHLADMRSSPLSSMLLDQTDKISTDGDAQKFLRDTGLSPMKDVDLLVVATSPVLTAGGEPEVLVAAEGRFNSERLSAALIERGAVRKGVYLLLPESAHDREGRGGAVAFPDAHLALMGTETAVVEALKARSSGGTTFTTASGLGRDILRIDPHATAWALIDVPRAQRLAANHPGHENQAFSAAVKNMSTVALWATDSGDALKLGAFGIAHDADTLQLVEDTIRGALAAMRLAVQDKSPQLVSVLRKFAVARGEDSVTVSGALPAEAIRSLMKTKHLGASAR